MQLQKTVFCSMVVQDLALIKGLRRNATVVCMEETQLLVMDKKDFSNNRMEMELKKEYEYRFNFFRYDFHDFFSLEREKYPYFLDYSLHLHVF